jgi:hypothetical protein
MGRDEGGWIGYEGLSRAAREAYGRVQGETGSFDAGMEATVPRTDRPVRASGEDWDVEDDDENRRRLPRLSALFLEEDD